MPPAPARFAARYLRPLGRMLTWSARVTSWLAAAGVGALVLAPGAVFASPAVAGAAAPSIPLTISGTSTPVAPGRPGTLTLSLGNPSASEARVSVIRTTVLAGSPGCSPAWLEVGAFSGELLVPARGSSHVTLRVELAPHAPAACQGVTWQLQHAVR